MRSVSPYRINSVPTCSEPFGNTQGKLSESMISGRKLFIRIITAVLFVAYLTAFNYGGCGESSHGSSTGSSAPTPTPAPSTETVSRPTQPTGTTSGTISTSYSYSTGGASSNLGDSIEYRFDWGDGTYSNWSLSTSASHSWSSNGTYTVKAQARCAIHTSVISTYWSSALSVNITNDAWDPTDDTASNGTWLNPATSSQSHGPHTLSSSDLYDWFRINMTTGYIYYFNTVGGSGDNYGELYSNSTGTNRVAYNDDSGNNRQFDFSYSAVNTQTYYLRVRTYSEGDGWSGSLNYYYSGSATEIVNTPTQPTGPNTGNVYTSYSYSTGGASSTSAHSIEYRFDWGDGTYSNWSPLITISKSTGWSSGTYTVKAQARCATHTSIVSSWSSGRSVTISIPTETVSTPNRPSGTISVETGLPYSYSVNGASSNLDDSLQYRFDWGDGTYSNWASSSIVSKSGGWSSGDTYMVKAQARCATHTSILSSWSPGLLVTISSQTETISTPSLRYITSGIANISYNFSSSSGASSNLGHPVEYQFDWGDGTYSNWSSSTTTPHSWASAGIYTVKIQARCATHTSIISRVTSSDPINIFPPASEIVNTPDKPTGTLYSTTDTSYNYSTGGAYSDFGHSVEYCFDWGDGTYSNWSSSTSASHSWSSAGTYIVKAQARCATDITAVSLWSLGLSVSIGTPPPTETVSIPNQPAGQTSGTTGTSYSYSTGGASSTLGHSVEYCFDWGDGTYSNWSSSTSASHSWSSAGTYIVKAQARCATDTSVTSESAGLSVTITLATNSWTEKIAYDWDNPNLPSPREKHSMVWDGTRVIMFGGFDGTHKNDLWWYYPITNTWTQKIPTGGPPPGRQRASMVWDGTKVIMFGGEDMLNQYDDLWWYYPITNTWTKKIPTTSPIGRFGHQMVWDNVGQRVIMFGGANLNNTHMNDLWWYYPITNTWTQKIPTGGPPSARNEHSMVWDGTKVIMFGGYDGTSTYKNDLWWYNPISNSWTQKITQDAIGSPLPRGAHQMVWDDDRVIMFGGSDMNDLWWYQP